MKKNKVILLVIAIILSILWIINLIDLCDMSKVFDFVRQMFLTLGVPFVGILWVCAFSSTEDTKGGYYCDRCGEKIKKEEKSLHFVKEEKDFCEKCAKTVK